MKITYDGSKGAKTKVNIPGRRSIIFKAGETKEIGDQAAKDILRDLTCFNSGKKEEKKIGIRRK